MIVYKICCNITNEIYVGSTSDYERRKKQHIWSSNPCLSKQIIDRNDYCFEIIEELDLSTTTHQLLLRENYWINNLKSINKVLPLLTEEQKIESRKIRDENNKIKSREYYYNNKDTQLEVRKNYRLKNIELIKSKKTEKIVCSCGKIYSVSNQARHIKSSFHNNNM